MPLLAHLKTLGNSCSWRMSPNCLVKSAGIAWSTYMRPLPHHLCVGPVSSRHLGQAAAERGLRVAYCSVNGHQIGAPVGYSAGGQACWQFKVFTLVGQMVILLCHSTTDQNRNLDLARAGLPAHCIPRVQFLQGLKKRQHNLSIKFFCNIITSDLLGSTYDDN